MNGGWDTGTWDEATWDYVPTLIDLDTHDGDKLKDRFARERRYGRSVAEKFSPCMKELLKARKISPKLLSRSTT